MKKLLTLSLGVLLLAGSATSGFAQRYEDPNSGHHSGKVIDDMLKDHVVRIREGSRSGSLTHEEADRIREKEDRVRVKLDEFRQKNHGFLTNNEENSLEGTMNELDRELHNLKHNDAVR